MSAVLYVRHADTGSLPVLLVGDDGQRYWAKWPGNPHANQSLVHEWVVTALGEALQAPVRPGVLMYVDRELVEGIYIDGHSLPEGTYFGSLALDSVEEQTMVDHVRRDGNAQRFPFFLALWDLCMGDDVQLLYDRSNDSQVWSIDHGCWFNSLEGPWEGRELRSWVSDPWEWPQGRHPKGLDATALHAAADAVESLTSQAIGEAVGGVPLEWGVGDDDLTALAEFIYGRRFAVGSRLRTFAARS